MIEPDIAREAISYNDVPPATPITDQQQFLQQNDSFMPPPSVLPPPTPQMHSMMSPSHSMASYSMPMTPGIPMTPGTPMTPGVPMTPGNLLHGDLSASLSVPTPTMPINHDNINDHHNEMPEPPTYDNLGHHDDDLHHEGMLPGGMDHGGMTPHHTIENMESIPNLPADQISSILNEGAAMDKNDGSGLGQYANMGFEGHPNSPRANIQNDWNDDYDFPPSVGHVCFNFLNLFLLCIL